MFRKCSGFEKILDNQVSLFCQNFSSHLPKFLWGNPSMIHKNLAMHRFYAPKRSSTIFGGKFLVSQYRKTSWGNAFVFQKISSTEKNYGEEWSVTLFRRKLFVQNSRKTSWADPSDFQKCSDIKFFLDNRGITTLSNFSSHIAKNHRGRTVLCFRNILVSNCFG